MKKAVFLDRDGVINRLVFNPDTEKFESPHKIEDLSIFHYVIPSMQRLQDNGYQLFLISNQPSYAKGKTSMENIQAIHSKLHEILLLNGIKFTEYFYCYHHPDGIVPELSGPCECRKPGNYFLKLAKKKYDLDFTESWLIGDQDTDIQCAQSCGLKTVLIEEPCSADKRGITIPDYKVKNLEDAVAEILINNDIIDIKEGRDEISSGT